MILSIKVFFVLILVLLISSEGRKVQKLKIKSL